MVLPAIYPEHEDSQQVNIELAEWEQIINSNILNQEQIEMPEASLIPDSNTSSTTDQDVEGNNRSNVPVPSTELRQAISDEVGGQRSDFKAEVKISWDVLKVVVGGIISVYAGNGKVALAGHKLLFNSFILSTCASLFSCALVILIGYLRPPTTQSMVWLVSSILRASGVFFFVFVTSMVALLLHMSGMF